MRRVFKTLKSVLADYPDVELVYPVHLSPAVQKAAKDILANTERIHLIEPLDVMDFHNLANKSYFIMSDSGGVQEEAPSLGKPVLVLRDTTERPEGVAAGTLRLVGTQEDSVKNAMISLLDNKEEYDKMAQTQNPYGDGQASKRILEAISYYFNNGARPDDFGTGE